MPLSERRRSPLWICRGRASCRFPGTALLPLSSRWRSQQGTDTTWPVPVHQGSRQQRLLGYPPSVGERDAEAEPLPHRRARGELVIPGPRSVLSSRPAGTSGGCSSRSAAAMSTTLTKALSEGRRQGRDDCAMEGGRVSVDGPAGARRSFFERVSRRRSAVG